MPNVDKFFERTQIDQLPKLAQEIFKQAHDSALKEYQAPSKRRNSDESTEGVAHKVVWDAVKNEYEKEGDEWVKELGPKIKN